VTGALTGPLVLTNPFALPDVMRGSETLVQGLGTWLRPRLAGGVNVMAGGRRSSTYALEGLDYRRVRAPDLRRLYRDLDPEVTFIPPMAACLKQAHPALVHSFLYTDAAAARAARVPYVVSYGGIALPDGFRSRRLKWRLFHFASARARRIFCPSAAAAIHMRETYGYRAEVLPNGLDTSPYWQPGVERDPGLIVCAATPDDRRKRVEILVQAFSRVALARPDLHLVLAGAAGPSARSRLLELLDEPLRSRVEFVGDLDPVALRNLYSTAALTCLPSINEAFGLVLVESLAAGTPVVGAEHGAIPEVVTPEVGALFEPDDFASCATAIDNVLNRSDQGSDLPMREECRKQAAKFDWDVVGPLYLSAYEEAC
jgi:phosphatidylinositol alpha-mannosyltransferase